MKFARTTILITSAAVMLAGASLILWAVMIGLTKLDEVNRVRRIMKRLEAQDA